MSRLTRQRSVGSAEADVVDPRDDNEAPARGLVARLARRELLQQDRGDNESDAVADVSSDHGPSPTRPIDEEDTAQLCNQSENGRNGLVLQRLVAGDTHLREDVGAVVLDSANSSHLHGSLDGAGEEEPTETGAIGEKLNVGLGLVLVLEGQGVLDLIEFSAYPRVVDVAIGVEFGEGAEAVVDAAVVDEPAAGMSVHEFLSK